MPTLSAPRRIDRTRAVSLFHALSDPTRLAVLDMLRDGERCVCDLQDELDAAQSRLSFHLKVLRDAGLVEDRREGRWSYYRIVPQAVAQVHDAVVAFEPRHAALPIRRTGACCG
jgi:ArsR family transcriptional regulator